MQSKNFFAFLNFFQAFFQRTDVLSPVIRFSELFHEQLRYAILMRFNLSSRPILNNMSGERSLLLKK